MKAHQVPTSMLADLWSAATPYMVRALRFHPFLRIESLYQLILSGRAVLYVFVDESQVVGAAALEAVSYPPDVVGNVIAIGGEQGSLRRYGDEVIAVIERWCRGQNCTKIAVLGRQGWSRYLARRHWRAQLACVAWLPLQD